VYKRQGWEKASILVTGSYPQWKVEVLQWMQEKFDEKEGFPETFMKDLKVWSSENVQDKKLMKFTMQFASFTKSEVEEVGSMAMDIQLPFDQKEILSECIRYIKGQLSLPDVDVIDIDTDSAAADIPAAKAEIATPGKPYLWLR